MSKSIKSLSVLAVLNFENLDVIHDFTNSCTLVFSVFDPDKLQCTPGYMIK